MKNNKAKRWQILTDFRHPLTGVKIDIDEWFSLSLHHWRTAGGHENKYSCVFLSLIPLPQGGDFGHSTITQDVKNYPDTKGPDWENYIGGVIEALLNGKIPSIWEKNMDSDEQRAYRSHLRKVISILKIFLEEDEFQYKKLVV